MKNILIAILRWVLIKTEGYNMETKNEKFEIKVQGDWQLSGMPVAPSWVGKLPRFVKYNDMPVDVLAVLKTAIAMADKNDHEPNDGEFDIETPSGTINLPIFGKTKIDGDIEISVREATLTTQSFVGLGSTAIMLKNDAKFVSQSVPSTMVKGGKYTVALTYKNAGSATWLGGGTTGYGIRSQNPDGTTRWGLNAVWMPKSSATPTSQNRTFTFTVTAPINPGNYNFQWRMRQAGVGNFGEFSPNVLVSVVGLSHT